MVATTEQEIEIRELDGQFYASSPRRGWYWVKVEDATHAPFCECENHAYRLRGTKVDCKHLAALRAYLAERNKPHCPCCGQPVPEAPATDLPWDAATEAKFVARRAALFGEAR